MNVIDDLLAQIPDGRIRDVRVGAFWTAVVAETNEALRCGLASTLRDDEHHYSNEPTVHDAGACCGGGWGNESEKHPGRQCVVDWRQSKQAGVRFDHAEYQLRQKQQTTSEEQACAPCHHLNKPEDTATPCWECHRDMYLPTSIFDHKFRQKTLGGNVSCGECHMGEHVASSAVDCNECHEKMVLPEDRAVEFRYVAPSYVDASHNRCLVCHQREAIAQKKENLPRCPTCHQPADTEKAVQKLSPFRWDDLE